MRALVVYYSRAGHTREIAGAIAGEVQCDTEEIVETTKPSGPLGYFTARRQARKGETTEIRPAQRDPTRYELVIVGTPILLGSLPAPVRTYLRKYGKQLKKVSFFATFSGVSTGTAFEEMEELCGKAPAGTLAVNDAAVKEDAYVDSVKEYCGRLKGV